MPTTATMRNPEKRFVIRVAFTVRLRKQEYETLVNGIEDELKTKEVVDIGKPNTFWKVFEDGTLTVEGTCFDHRRFDERCVEVYKPDVVPPYECPHQLDGKYPSITLIITDSLLDWQFVDSPPAKGVPENTKQAKSLFVNYAKNPYDTINDWGLGILDEAVQDYVRPYRKVQLAVGERLFERTQAQQILQALTGISPKKALSRVLELDTEIG